MPLSSGAHQPPNQFPVINQESGTIPQEYLVPIVQPAPDNQPRDPIVPAAPQRVNIVDQVGNLDERLERRGFLPFVFAVTCPAVMLILLLRALIN